MSPTEANVLAEDGAGPRTGNRDAVGKERLHVFIVLNKETGCACGRALGAIHILEEKILCSRLLHKAAGDVWLAGVVIKEQVRSVEGGVSIIRIPVRFNGVERQSITVHFSPPLKGDVA
mmetsp:Transcript_3099/g.3662  ORF Transcript_3099/g.3662 Transcript_3099/m.3662 type:complete len:119 (+) Transcript_3099:1926-2282(+)